MRCRSMPAKADACANSAMFVSAGIGVLDHASRTLPAPSRTAPPPPGVGNWTPHGDRSRTHDLIHGDRERSVRGKRELVHKLPVPHTRSVCELRTTSRRVVLDGPARRVHLPAWRRLPSNVDEARRALRRVVMLTDTRSTSDHVEMAQSDTGRRSPATQASMGC
jgi:hypothetical protein